MQSVSITTDVVGSTLAQGEVQVVIYIHIFTNVLHTDPVFVVVGLVWFNGAISWRSVLLVEETGGPGESGQFY
jgi:predicted N-formylglutamate amidohydrolase